MNCDTSTTEVIDSQYTANDISSHVVKDQYLPDWLAILIQDCWRLDGKPICMAVNLVVWTVARLIVQAQDLLNRSYHSHQHGFVAQLHSLVSPICRSRRVGNFEAMASSPRLRMLGERSDQKRSCRDSHTVRHHSPRLPRPKLPTRHGVLLEGASLFISLEI